MSLYVLDTDLLSLFHRGHAAVVHNVAQHQLGELAIAVITVEEQLTGWYTLLRQAKRNDQVATAYDNLARNVRHLSGWNILTFPEAAILRFEQLRQQSSA